MADKLVIVESPAKAKTINKMLGGEFTVMSSMGHIRDLPEKTLGVDVDNDFAPKYVLVKSREKIVGELKRAAKKSVEIFLAPDPDREGESIAWHLYETLRPANPKAVFRRVQYNEITAEAVRKAFANPGEIDQNRVDAQQARRLLDRIVGYRVSPLLWRRLKRGLSAGRVQSVALRLVCERESEIRSFVPEAYWVAGAIARKLVDPRDQFRLALASIDGEKARITSDEQAASVASDLAGCGLRVKSVSVKRMQKRPPPPFITSTLQQAASSRYGVQPSRTMRIAQSLYEGVDMGDGPVGLITYMRTDSVSVARSAAEACLRFVEQRYGADYRPDKPNVYASRASAQEAHEAIRPTDVARTPESLSGVLDAAALRIYALIWNRFVSSQMAPAQLDVRTVEVAAVPRSAIPHAYDFRASATDIAFPGYMKVWEESRPESAGNENTDEVERLPPLAEGEDLECLEWLSERKETKPPGRYSEASLIRELERNGIGRPSTYAQILSTLQQRRYVAREKRSLLPTDLGEGVNAFLVANLPKLVEVGFTAEMEQDLDRIEKGEVQWTGMLAAFYKQFCEWVEAARGPDADTGSVDKLLLALAGVTEWAAPQKRGRRTVSDEGFVQSVREQREAGQKPVSDRQLKALAKMLWRYRDQVPGGEALLKELGLDGDAAPAASEPIEVSAKKLELLNGVEIDESARRFVDSLSKWVEGGRPLTFPQKRALESVIARNSGKIEGFETRANELGLGAAAADAAGPDNVSGPLLEAMSHVREWREPSKRGKRVFDDKAFYESLNGQFHMRKSLSPRQQEALKKMVSRYGAQVPDFARLVEAFGIKVGRRAGKDGGKQSPE